MGRMPSTITHTYFTQDVLEKLPISVRELLIDEKDMLKIYGQSMDVLFFYNITNLRKGKRIRQFGHYFHEHQTQEFFINLINYIKYNHYGTTPSVMSFLYGMICHYVLDSTIHPYVIYKTGIYEKNDPKTYAYKQRHEHMETFLDNYLLLQREGKKPYRIKSHHFCFAIKPLTKKVQEVMDYSFKETFDINHMSKFYTKALRQMRFFFRYFRTDRLGVKKKFYWLLDHLTPKNAYQLEVLSYHIDPIDQWNYLNWDKQEWNHPANLKEKYNHSFVELYMIAISKAVKLIKEVNQYIYEDKKISLKKLFPDLSYVSGKKCNSKKTLQYFEKKC